MSTLTPIPSAKASRRDHKAEQSSGGAKGIDGASVEAERGVSTPKKSRDNSNDHQLREIEAVMSGWLPSASH